MKADEKLGARIFNMESKGKDLNLHEISDCKFDFILDNQYF